MIPVEMFGDIMPETDWVEYSAHLREKQWKSGLHTTKDGRTLKIKEMETCHLLNTINYFKGLDTNPLRKELEKRNY